MSGVGLASLLHLAAGCSLYLIESKQTETRQNYGAVMGQSQYVDMAKFVTSDPAGKGSGALR